MLSVVSIVFCAAAGQLSCDQNSGHWFQIVWYGAPESGWPSSESSWQCYYMLGTTTKLLMPFQVQGLGLQLKETLFLGSGLTPMERNIKKSTETRLKKKNIKKCKKM